MNKNPSREQLVRKGRATRKVAIALSKLQGLVTFTEPEYEVIRLDSKYGKVNTLWYGWENRKTTPLYIDLHGGGFILGSPEMDDAMNQEIARQVGCKIVSINYAKAPDFPFPAAVDQVYSVINQILDNSERFAIEPGKVAIGGHSAGGNLATVTCIKAKREGKLQFCCQILDYPVLDLATNPYDKPTPKGAIPPEMALMFNSCYVDPDQAKDPLTSPVFTKQEELEGLPPALFILAGRDSLFGEGKKYCQMLSDVGVKTECAEYPNALHGFTCQSSVDTTDAIKKMVDFLRKYLLG